MNTYKPFMRKAIAFALSLCFVFGISIAENNVKSQRYYLPPSMQKYQPATVSAEDLITTDNKNERVQALEFGVIDSLSNAFSYIYIKNNKAFVLDRTTGNLMTAKRGYINPNMESHSDLWDSESRDRSFNILLRKSTDMGATWEPPILIYDRDAISYFTARYPTLYGFEMDDKQHVAFTFPVIDYIPGGESSWKGFVSQVWNEGITEVEDIPINANTNLTHEGIDYNWGLESRAVAGTMPEDPDSYFMLAVGELSPVNEYDFANACHLAIRKVYGSVEEIEQEIPDAWNSSNFRTVDQPNSRFNQLIDFRMIPNGEVYLAVYGGFYHPDPAAENPNTVGVSKSTDYGETWDEFDKLPKTVRDSYCSEQGYPGGLFIFQYTTKGFVVFDNGDYSILVHGGLYDGSGQDPNYVGSQIVEIYKEDGQWGMRKVADITGAHITYSDIKNADEQRSNPSDIELQAARTVDGELILAKWVDLEDYDPDQGSFSTTDIYIAARYKQSSEWGEKQNVTESEKLDRITLLPDYVPNDLDQVPLMKLYSVTGEGESERDSQFVATMDQYLMFAGASEITLPPMSVEDKNNYANEAEVKIIPNPTSSKTAVNVYYEGKAGTAEIALYDMMGRKVKTIYEGTVGFGAKNYRFNASDLSAGAYYCSITINGRTITKRINIVR